MYASPVVDTAKLENLDHADWLEETNMDELRYFSIGMIQKDIVAVSYTHLSEKGVEKRLFSKDRSAEIDRRVILFLSARCTVTVSYTHLRAPLAPPPQNHREISLTPDQSPVFALL